ncbi:DUF2179 domain-containing protein [Mycoplasmopsis ciconiae]|uniref:DUF2179 domain-containing protein n=1 Tax=Mycoplasmopsis ciconiae TaxID=561067 RepID=A0ABU7MLV5_9BACT|nr:DUF2179 domain-containing protein [Mycoplasmopsis ciconiae]
MSDKKKIELFRKKKQNVLTEIYDKDQDEFNTVNKNSKVIKANTTYRRTKMNNFGLKISKLYSPMPMYKVLIITTIVAIFFGVISVFFVKNVGIYNFGLAAFGQAAARLVVVKLPASVAADVRNLIDQIIFWLAYIILSIPIFIFGYYKIGRIFTILTVLFLIVSSFTSIGIGLIPGANEVYLIGDFSNKAVQEALPEYQKKLSNLIPLFWNEGGNIIALMIYSMSYGFMLAWVFAIIAILGGTAGVTGVIGEWYANTKQKSFGTISGYMNIVIVLISVLVGSWLPGSLLLSEAEKLNGANNQALRILADKAWGFEMYLSPNFVATILSNVVYIAVLNKLYPKFKLVRVEIFSMYCDDVKDKILLDRKIVTGITLFKGEGGYSKKQIDVITSITLFRQIPRIIKDVRKIDPEAFIAVSEVNAIDGYVYLPEKKF